MLFDCSRYFIRSFIQVEKREVGGTLVSKNREIPLVLPCERDGMISTPRQGRSSDILGEPAREHPALPSVVIDS